MPQDPEFSAVIQLLRSIDANQRHACKILEQIAGDLADRVSEIVENHETIRDEIMAASVAAAPIEVEPQAPDQGSDPPEAVVETPAPPVRLPSYSRGGGFDLSTLSGIADA